MSPLIRYMQAIVVPIYGGAEVLQHKEVAIPSITPEEILVQVHSAGVSPFDIHVRDGWYKASPNYPLPIILGWELSGVVVDSIWPYSRQNRSCYTGLISIAHVMAS